MDRRKFLKIGAAGAAAATAFPDAFASALPLKKKASAKDGFIREPSREIPVVASYDVLVAGGGPSGVAAALAVNSRDCVRDIDIPILQETLRRQGALLEI